MINISEGFSGKVVFLNFVFHHPKVFSDSRCIICVCVDLCLYQLLSGPCGHDVDPEIQKSSSHRFSLAIFRLSQWPTLELLGVIYLKFKIDGLPIPNGRLVKGQCTPICIRTVPGTFQLLY